MLSWSGCYKSWVPPSPGHMFCRAVVAIEIRTSQLSAGMAMWLRVAAVCLTPCHQTYRGNRQYKKHIFIEMKIIMSLSLCLCVCFSVGRLCQVSLSRSSAVGPLGHPGVSTNARSVQRNNVSTAVIGCGFLSCWTPDWFQWETCIPLHTRCCVCLF